jgi:hypothetical protein
MCTGKAFEEAEEILPSDDSVVPIVDDTHHTAANSLSEETFTHGMLKHC